MVAPGMMLVHLVGPFAKMMSILSPALALYLVRVLDPTDPNAMVSYPCCSIYISSPVTLLHLHLTVNYQYILIVKVSSRNLNFTSLARISLQVEQLVPNEMFFYKLSTIWIVSLSVFPSIL